MQTLNRLILYICPWLLSQICLRFLHPHLWLVSHSLPLCNVVLSTTTQHTATTEYLWQTSIYNIFHEGWRYFSTRNLSVKKDAPLADFLIAFSSVRGMAVLWNALTPVANPFLCSRQTDMPLGAFGYFLSCYAATEKMKIIFHTPI